MRFVGVDLSLQATGIACDCGSVVIKSRKTGPERMHNLSSDVRSHATGTCTEPGIRPALVLIEGYSFMSKSAHAHEIGALGGVVRVDLWREGLTYVEISPSSLKLFATGKGNAGKDEVLAGAIRQLGFEGTNNNEADAWVLREMARYHYTPVSCPEPHAYQRKALAGVKWPEASA